MQAGIPEENEMLRSGTRRATGISELVVLKCIADEEKYGYEIAQEVLARTEGEIEMREGQLYPLLHDLAGGGYLSTRKETVDGRPRVYYRLTSKGRALLADLRDDWTRMVQAMKKVLT